MSKESVCQEADRIVSEDRQKAYGHPYDDFWTTAEILRALGYMKQPKGGRPQLITAYDIPQILRAVKESRLNRNPTHRDSLVDICGYAKTQDMLRERSVNCGGCGKVPCVCKNMVMTAKAPDPED